MLPPIVAWVVPVTKGRGSPKRIPKHDTLKGCRLTVWAPHSNSYVSLTRIMTSKKVVRSTLQGTIVSTKNAKIGKKLTLTAEAVEGQVDLVQCEHIA